VAGAFGPIAFAGEWYWSMFNKASTGGQRNDVTLSGGYIQATYFITGEMRPMKDTTWSRPMPNANFHDGGGGPGAWEVGARFSYIDLKDNIIQGDQGYTFTLGLNWYWNPNTRFMFNYVYADNDEVAGSDASGGTTNQFLFRLQIDW
jgi:phosphate-selective porin OprO/OprP